MMMLPPEPIPRSHEVGFGSTQLGYGISEIVPYGDVFDTMDMLPGKLWIATYTYNSIITEALEKLGRLDRFIFAQVNKGSIPTNARCLRNNHTKLILYVEEQQVKSKKKTVPLHGFLGSGNLVGPGILHDYMVRLSKSQRQEALYIFERLWSLATPINETDRLLSSDHKVRSS